jgi:hypothetical protein
MNTKMTQAWGWLVAGVLAAGLNASYHDGGLRWAHQAVCQIYDQVEHRSVAVLDLASGHVDRFISEVRLLTARNETVSRRLTTVMAQVQTKQVQAKIARSQVNFDRFQALADRQEAQRARFEVNRGRVEAQMARIRSEIDPQIAHLRISAATFAPVAFRAGAVSVACPRTRVSVPQLPVIRIQAPAIEIESGPGPI